MLGLGVAVMPLQFCTSPKKETAIAELDKSKLDKFGIQLYSIKEDMAIDPQATMRLWPALATSSLRDLTVEKEFSGECNLLNSRPYYPRQAQP